MKLLHLDLETTGLDPLNNQIIEIGMVYDNDSHLPFEQLPKFHCYVKHPVYKVDAYCMGLHKDMWPKLEKEGISLGEAIEKLKIWLYQVGEVELTNTSRRSFTLCGKNVAGFDWQFFKAAGIDQHFRREGIVIKHRMLDVGTLWTNVEDSVIPDLKECCVRAGLGEVVVPHTALGDCELTVGCVRARWPVLRSEILEGENAGSEVLGAQVGGFNRQTVERAAELSKAIERALEIAKKVDPEDIKRSQTAKKQFQLGDFPGLTKEDADEMNRVFDILFGSDSKR